MIVRRVLRRILPLSVYLRYFGRHDQGTRHVWSKLASMVESDRVILDIGAHVGEFAVLARQVNSNSPIMAFEPNPASFKTLERVGEQNDFKAFQNAVSNYDGEVSFQCQAVTGHLVDGDGHSSSSEAVETVKSVRIDSWASEARARIGLVKIDVEKAEPSVLEGMQTSLREDLPMIICEVLSDEVGRKIQHLLPADFLYFGIDENRGIVASETIRRIGWRHLNWLFVPRHMSERVLSCLSD